MIADLKLYPSMKDSGVPWLGAVPEHWAVRRGKNIFRCVDVRSETGKEELLTVSSERGVVPRRSTTVTMFKAESYVDHKLCWPGDLVINSLWAWARGLGVSQYHGIVSTAYGVYRPLAGANVEPRFIHDLVRSTPFHWELQVRSKGVWTSRLQLTDEAFLGSPFPLPPAAEQAAIVRYLDYMDRRIRKYIRAKQKLIKLLEEQKQAIIHRAVTRGLDPNVCLKPSGVEWLGDVPEHWEVRKIKAYVDVRDGTHDTPPYVETGEDTFPLVTSRHIHEGRVSLETAPHISKANYYEIARRSFVARGDILMPMIGTIGNPCVVETDTPFAIKNVALFRTSISTALLPEYLCSLLKSNSIMRQMEDLSRGGVQGFVGLNTLRNLLIAIPTLDEQKSILQHLGSATRSCSVAIALAHRGISLLREYRTRLIADVVTGKLDVREAAVRLPDESDESVLLDDVEEAADNETNDSVMEVANAE